LLQDSAFDIDAWLSQRFGERYGRGLEALFTTGTGSGQPTGILTAIAASGATPIVAAGSSTNDGSVLTGANSIGSQDLVSLEHSVDPAYRRGAHYMFHDTTLGQIQKILDKFGRPLWQPGLSSDVPDLINGYPYVLNQSMAVNIASGGPSEATTVVFGDLSKFMIRKVSDMSMKRLEELYAINGQVGFLSFMRVDSNLVANNGGRALNVLQQHS
jgi:HK97 family phage major capsid protein